LQVMVQHVGHGKGWRASRQAGLHRGA
jgi:hypothetical protein